MDLADVVKQHPPDFSTATSFGVVKDHDSMAASLTLNGWSGGDSVPPSGQLTSTAAKEYHHHDREESASPAVPSTTHRFISVNDGHTDLESGVFSSTSSALRFDYDDLPSPTPSVNSVDFDDASYNTLTADDEEYRMNMLDALVENLRLERCGGWDTASQAPFCDFAAYEDMLASNCGTEHHGGSTPRSATPPRIEHNDPKSLKRCRSLRSALKSSASPPTSCRKFVRFADSMGLDLERVKHIMDDEFDAAVSDDETFFGNFVMRPTGARNSSSFSGVGGCGSRCMVAHFVLPDVMTTRRLVDQRNVKVESVNVVDFLVTGLIRVANMAFEKQLYVRYTMDGWRTWTETSCAYVDHSSVDGQDAFSFTLFLPYDLPMGSRCEFAVRYCTDGRVFWDNNDQRNYLLVCQSSPSLSTATTGGAKSRQHDFYLGYYGY